MYRNQIRCPEKLYSAPVSKLTLEVPSRQGTSAPKHHGNPGPANTTYPGLSPEPPGGRPRFSPCPGRIPWPPRV